MTDQERHDAAVGRATRELREAEEKLIEAREKARDVADRFESVANALRRYTNIREPIGFPHPFPIQDEAVTASRALHQYMLKIEECQLLLKP